MHRKGGRAALPPIIGVFADKKAKHESDEIGASFSG
jgi:hypothetical protein